MRTEYRGEVWQDGMMMAAVEGQNYVKVNAQTAHYAFVYSQDGPVLVKRFEKKPKKRWRETK